MSDTITTIAPTELTSKHIGKRLRVTDLDRVVEGICDSIEFEGELISVARLSGLGQGGLVGRIRTTLRVGGVTFHSGDGYPRIAIEVVA